MFISRACEWRAPLAGGHVLLTERVCVLRRRHAPSLCSATLAFVPAGTKARRCLQLALVCPRAREPPRSQVARSSRGQSNLPADCV